MKMNYLYSTCFCCCDLKMLLILHVLSPQVVPKSRHPDDKTQPWNSQKGVCEDARLLAVTCGVNIFAICWWVCSKTGQEVNDETVRMMLAALFYWLEDSQLESDEIWAEKKVESKFSQIFCHP